MIEMLALFAGSLVLGVVTCRIAYRIVRRLEVIDHPNVRSSHERPTPRGGGLGILMALLPGACVGIVVLGGPHRLVGAVALLGCLLLLAGLGFADDRRGTGVVAKALIQVGAAVIAVAALGPVKAVGLPGGVVALGWLAAPLTVFWLVGFSNAFNFMDGIDGIAALFAGTAALCLFAMAKGGGGVLLPLAGASLAFLTLNWPPARVFMGDVGSLPVGFLLAALALPGVGTGLPFLVVFLALGPFLFDTIYTLLRRAVRGENVLAAHRSHLYQRLVIAGLSHRAVTLLYGGWTLLSGCLGFLYLWGGVTARGAVLGAVLVAALMTGAGLVLVVRRLERGRSGDESGV
ncbi:MAG: glycosyltransferase family 4 protein [Planctomycetota bacterium]|jgi:UDP-N-acetylmuramyl pentapeptide phosphotransferase/UDP-N-acetylglucosamine-1-phosphate transferase